MATGNLEGKTYRPHDAAQVVGIHANSIRTWCEIYAELLSDASQEKPRKLTAQDVATLQAVKQLRDEGFDPPAILYRLSQVPDSDLRQPHIDAPQTPQLPTMGSSAALPAIVDSGASIAAQRLSEIAGARLDVIDQRIAQLERQRSIVAAAIVGAIAGAALVALGIFIASMLLR